jgi:hypothetical protein
MGRVVSKLEVWRGKSFPYEMIAWLRIHGVPIQLWDRHAFDRIGERFGVLMQCSQAFAKDTNISSDCVGILVNDYGRIYDEITLRWKDKAFWCWVTEDTLDWVLDFLLSPTCNSNPSPLVHNSGMDNPHMEW